MVTRIEEATRHRFWPAEDYDQKDVLRNQGTKDCYDPVNRFGN